MAFQLEYWKVQQECWDKNYFVYVKPLKRGVRQGGHPVRIVVDFDGTKKYGKKEYKQHTEELNYEIEYAYRYVWHNYIRNKRNK
jgi:hypothetical protein|tara:strand:- start:6372 stop:6623 length:252 start_codon:yes stop_codon:yes gene_type:complete